MPLFGVQVNVINDKVMYSKTVRPTDMQNQVTEIFNQVIKLPVFFVYKISKPF